MPTEKPFHCPQALFGRQPGTEGGGRLPSPFVGPAVRSRVLLQLQRHYTQCGTFTVPGTARMVPQAVGGPRRGTKAARRFEAPPDAAPLVASLFRFSFFFFPFPVSWICSVIQDSACSVIIVGLGSSLGLGWRLGNVFGGCCWVIAPMSSTAGGGISYNNTNNKNNNCSWRRSGNRSRNRWSFKFKNNQSSDAAMNSERT